MCVQLNSNGEVSDEEKSYEGGGEGLAKVERQDRWRGELVKRDTYALQPMAAMLDQTHWKGTEGQRRSPPYRAK